jgi:hypothetical protein
MIMVVTVAQSVIVDLMAGAILCWPLFVLIILPVFISVTMPMMFVFMMPVSMTLAFYFIKRTYMLVPMPVLPSVFLNGNMCCGNTPSYDVLARDVHPRQKFSCRAHQFLKPNKPLPFAQLQQGTQQLIAGGSGG